MAGRTLLPPVEDLPRRFKRALWYRDRQQKDVAEAIGVSKNTLSNIMRGNTADPGFSVIVAVAKNLNVSLDYLAGLSEEIEIQAPTSSDSMSVSVGERPKRPGF